MLKLTQVGSGSVYISPKHIASFEPAEDGTFIFTASQTYHVVETPEVILAMPEMVYEMYPMMAPQRVP